MEKNKGNISVRQLMLLFIVTVYAPLVRHLPGSTATIAKQAAWLSPLVSFLAFIILLYILQRMFNKYKGQSFMDIIYNLTSRFIGKIIVALYFIYLAILFSLNIRYYSERLVTSIYPNINMNVFIISMLVLVSVIIRSGIVVIARMSEIIFLLVTLVLFILLSLLIPNVNINNLTPVTYFDIYPIFKGSITGSSLFFLTFFLFFSHEVSNLENFFKEGLKAGILIWLISTLTIITSVGIMGHPIISRATLSFAVVVKNINILDVISGFEALLIATTITADFILIILFTYSSMHMIKSLFNLKDYKPFINIYLIIQYFLALWLAYDVFELQAFTGIILIYASVFFIFVFPVIIFSIGKIRKKI